jgi:sulfide dehydrogenase cytochrome subunit
MNKHICRLTLAVGLALLCQAGYADVDDIAAGCNGCHGDNGVSQWDKMPTIAGIDAFTHSESLYAYRDSERPCSTAEFHSGPRAGEEATMCEVAEPLSDDDIEALAEHYAALPFVPAKQEFDAALAEAGKAVHDDKCSRCHSDGGSNTEDEASILAGQWMGYLRGAFAEFASGDRYQPDKMKDVMDTLSDDDVNALIHYYASQQ